MVTKEEPVRNIEDRLARDAKGVYYLHLTDKYDHITEEELTTLEKLRYRIVSIERTIWSTTILFKKRE